MATPTDLPSLPQFEAEEYRPGSTRLEDWLVDRAKEHGLRWLLAHTDSGVIWGEYDPQVDNLRLSPATLSEKSLQQLRLFSENAELLLWRDGSAWRWRVLADTRPDAQSSTARQDCFDEPQLLWGSDQGKGADGFMRLSEGAEGQVHTPPALPGPEKQAARQQPPRLALVVRHYFAADDDGQAYIAYSRLVRLAWQ